MSLPSNVYESIHRAWMGDTLEGLKDFIRIPAKSRAFNPNWESDGILKRTLEDSADGAAASCPAPNSKSLKSRGFRPRSSSAFPPQAATRASLHSSTAISTSSLKPKAGARASAPGRPSCATAASTAAEALTTATTTI